MNDVNPTEGLSETRFARGIDTRLVQARHAARGTERRLVAAVNVLHRLLGTEPDQVEMTSRNWFWERAIDDLLEASRTAEVPYGVRRQLAAAATQVAAERVRLAQRYLHADRLEEIHDDHGGWWRYHRVPGGPLHLTTGCAALVLSEGVGSVLVFELSGVQPETIISAVGQNADLCGKCFQHKTIERERATRLSRHSRLVAG